MKGCTAGAVSVLNEIRCALADGVLERGWKSAKQFGLVFGGAVLTRGPTGCPEVICG